MNERGYFKLEENLRTLAQNAYVIAVYDSCREVPDPENDKLMEIEEFDDSLHSNTSTDINYVAIYGTAPSKLVDAERKLIKTLFGHFSTLMA